MPTSNQTKQLENKLRIYRKKYLTNIKNGLDESATRLMVNNLLTEVLGYIEFEEIKTEYEIRGAYADYVIQLNRKKYFVVEVKSISIDINDKHLRQSVGYAANEGIDWVLLTNGRQLELYHVTFSKPIGITKLFSFDLRDITQVDDASKEVVYLSKKLVVKGELEEYWKKSSALSPESLAKYLYSMDVIKLLRRELKKDCGVNFSPDDLLSSLSVVIHEPIDANLRLRKTK